MGSGQGTPGRRLRLVHPRRHEPEAPATPEQPRVEALDALLREVDGLRLTLETDLSLAASAVESGEPGLAADIIGSDREALRGFEARALGHLEALDTPHRKSVWAQAHAAPIVAAAALVGVLIGVAPHVTPPSSGPSQAVAASDSLERLQQLAENGDPAEVRAASFALHQQLAGVVAKAKTDPAAARTALLLLSYEQSAIVRSGDSQALADVLQQSRALARAIVAALPPAARASLRPIQPALAEPTASPKPKPKPTATASASPRSTTSPATKATPTPSSSPDKNDGYPLPAPPAMP